MTITIELPDDIEPLLHQRWDNLERHALEGFVIEAFRNGKLSSHSVGRILGMADRFEAIEFLSEKGVYPNYTFEDYLKDVENLEKVRQRAAK